MGSISLRRRGLWLECATLGWNVIGTVIVLNRPGFAGGHFG